MIALDIRAIIFDKDGTLMDFDSFWIEVSVYALNNILEKTKMRDVPVKELLKVLGADNGKVDIDGLLCKGTYEQIGLAIFDVLKNHGVKASSEEIVNMTLEAYNKSAELGTVKPTCENMRDILKHLKKIGIKLAIATTDSPVITKKCIEKLGIADLFDKIYTDDGIIPPKPDPWCAEDFSRTFDIPLKNIIMVGDTVTDIQFAKNAGISVIGVGRERDRLAPYADAVISDISHIFDVIKEV